MTKIIRANKKADSYRDRRNASLRCRPLPANRSPTMLGIGLHLFFGSCLFFNGPQETLRGLLCPSPLHSQHHSGPVFPGFFPKLFCGRGQLIFFKKKYRWGLHIQRYSILRTAVVITPTSAENRSGMQRFGSDCIFHVDLRV